MKIKIRHNNERIKEWEIIKNKGIMKQNEKEQMKMKEWENKRIKW